MKSDVQNPSTLWLSLTAFVVVPNSILGERFDVRHALLNELLRTHVQFFLLQNLCHKTILKWVDMTSPWLHENLPICQFFRLGHADVHILGACIFSGKF